MTKQPKQIPVFLFTGFLDSGKTTFVQGTLEDKRFNSGENILLIMCEDGEEEYDLSSFSTGNVSVRTVENEEDLNENTLSAWLNETGATRVVVEYNGLWMLQSLYDALPEGWIIVREITFADVTTFGVYNANMRNLVYDKINTCDAILFNRCADDTDTAPLHKSVRQINRRCDIVYEYPDGRSIPDETVDPMPFDVNAPIVKIEDRDYAYFYADLMENTEQYRGKTVEFKAVCMSDRGIRIPAGCFVSGRMLMNCCAADTQYAGMLCRQIKKPVPAKGTWIMLQGKIQIVANKLRPGSVPVLDVISYTPAEEPEDPVATFY